MLSDLQGMENVVFCHSLSNKYLSRLRYYHTSLKANKLFKLPFQSIWYPSYYNGTNGTSEYDVQIYFVFFQGTPLGYDPNYLHYLRQKYPNSKLCFDWINISSTVNSSYVSFVEKEYDLVFTFDANDSKKFGWIFHDAMYSDISKWSFKQLPQSDIFFVGGSKGRLQMIHSIYDKFTELGYKADFHVVNVSPEDQTRAGIVYNHYMSYEEVLQHCYNTKIILEIVQKGQNGATLRTCESITLRKKLLTNNNGLLKLDLYTPHATIFESVEQINPNEIMGSIIDEDLLASKIEHLSPSKFLDDIVAHSKL